MTTQPKPKKITDLLNAEDTLPPLISAITSLQANVVIRDDNGLPEIYLMTENGDRIRFTYDGALGAAMLLMQATRQIDNWSSETKPAGEFVHPLPAGVAVDRYDDPTKTADALSAIYQVDSDDMCRQPHCLYCQSEGTDRSGIANCPCRWCKEEYEHETKQATENDDILLGNWDVAREAIKGLLRSYYVPEISEKVRG